MGPDLGSTHDYRPATLRHSFSLLGWGGNNTHFVRYYEHQIENGGQHSPPSNCIFICTVLFLVLHPYGTFQSTVAFLNNSLIASHPPPAHMPQGGETDITNCFTDKETETCESRYWSLRGEVHPQNQPALALSP